MNRNSSVQDKITLFRSLFNGREDVFAKRWTNGSKTGYMPAYYYDPYIYKRHQMNGGTFKNFAGKSLLPLSDEQIDKHLEGVQQIGIYPLLVDNTSWFIAADFDKENWREEAVKFTKHCNSKGLHAYLERSQSGNGGHVWMFFDNPYPATKSRKILTSLLEETGIFSVFDKSSSFDRLFPNQDYHSGKGYGNLIALPFFKPALEKGNNCFVELDSMKPYQNQWEFLDKIVRISSTSMDQLYSSIDNNAVISTSNELEIRLKNQIRLNRKAIPLKLINFLKEEFHIANTEFFVKKKSGKSTWNTQRYFNLVSETETEVGLPRGAIGKVIRFCKENHLNFNFRDERKKVKEIAFPCELELRNHQKLTIQAVDKKDFGVIVAPPGSGKTVIGLKIIAEKKQPALIIVHRKQLFEQWMDRIESFLHIPQKEIGKIGHGKLKIGERITVALIQSLGKKVSEIDFDHFKTVIIDECHHVPAQSFQDTISQLSPYFQYGLTATPFRKYSDGKLIFLHLGEIISNIQPIQIERFKRAKIVIRNTELEVPFNSKTDRFETLSNILIHDSKRNDLILKDIIFELNQGNKTVVITERKEHIETLAQFLKQKHEVVTLSGDHSEKERKQKMDILNKGDFQVLITTGQFFGEGTDIQNISRLFLVYPFSFKGKLIQYIGRVQRGDVAPLIYDYRDQKIDYLNKMFLKRNVHYRNFDRQATLFDDIDTDNLEPTNSSTYKKSIKVAINDLDFRYGSVGVLHQDKELPFLLDFEIEHDHIRPEFDVLKPFFIKILGKPKVEIELFAEFKGEELIAQTACSHELEGINKELIDGVRFQFVEKKLFTGSFKSLSSSDQENTLQEGKGIYDSSEDLLEDILSNKDVKHSRQLRYLANNHQSKILKLRYVLNPFAFVFLLSGNQQFHVVLETLDTEEATYIWHLEKDIATLRSKVTEIDHALNIIKNKGRQAYIESEPKSFSKVIHDYSDNRKGFIVWKGMLEERLF